MIGCFSRDGWNIFFIKSAQKLLVKNYHAKNTLKIDNQKR